MRAVLDRFDRRLDRAVGGHHDNHRFRLALFDLPENGETVHAGHLEIGQDDIERPLARGGPPLLRRSRPGRNRSRRD